MFTIFLKNIAKNFKIITIKLALYSNIIINFNLLSFKFIKKDIMDNLYSF